MAEHPHPHIDPTFPDGIEADTNPPVFVWKPCKGNGPYTFLLKTEGGKEVIRKESLNFPLYLPDKKIPSGEYLWEWKSPRDRRTGSFRIRSTAPVIEVPETENLLSRFPADHPAIFTDAEKKNRLADQYTSRPSSRQQECAAYAEHVLKQDGKTSGFSGLRLPGHRMKEPPFLPDRNLDYSAFFNTWYRIMWDTRLFAYEAETTAAAYLLTRRKEFARAACRRMASLCSWDPSGSSSVFYNDEAHMPIIWHGTTCCDWVWGEFTPEEREIVTEGMTNRGRETFRLLTEEAVYGIDDFSSHSGREIIFLAMLSILLKNETPEAVKWMAWLRPILCGVWPVWGEPDGSWAEGHSYARPYVSIMTLFATALKEGTGIDLYRRPFWKNHLKWQMEGFPPYTDWVGFGDTGPVWKNTLTAAGDLVEVLSRQTGYTAGVLQYLRNIKAARRYAIETPEERRGIPSPAGIQLNFLSQEPVPDIPVKKDSVLSLYPGAGNGFLKDREIDFFFRSSPYGSISHSHADNNDFALCVNGKTVLAPSGFYCGYGSPHHAHWVWHTKSHNCLTLSDDGQVMRDPESRGAVTGGFEDEMLAYFTGIADESYRLRAEACRRHVIYFKPAGCFLIADTFEARPGILSSVQWNVHSPMEARVDPDQKTFTAESGGEGVKGWFLYSAESFFTVTENWEPGPEQLTKMMDYPRQFNLRFTPAEYAERRAVAVILRPVHRGSDVLSVSRHRGNNREHCLIEWGKGKKIEIMLDPYYTDTGSLMQIRGFDKTYTVGKSGINVQGHTAD